MSKLLEINDLSVSFGRGAGEVQAVRGVSFDINRGETVALVGESGSGKSVSALSVMQLLPYPLAHHPTGSVKFKGEELMGVADGRMRQLRGDDIAMIFQEPLSSLNPLHSIDKQIAEVLLLHKNITPNQAHARVVELLTLVGLESATERLTALPHEFSGGQQQRVMIAMALANDPELLIADEPTTALDVTVQAQILGLLKALTQETGAALILITHDLGVVARYADHVSVMYAGGIVESAPAIQLYSRPHHPYTQGLMASIPNLDGEVEARLTTIDGQPPDLAKQTSGCPFAPRCRAADPNCHTKTPPLEAVATNHLKACFKT